MSTVTNLQRTGLAVLVACAAAAVVVSTRGVAAPATAPAPSASQREAPREVPVALASLAIPTEKTAPPKPEEWASARAVLPARRTPVSRSCTVLLLREYVKVTCPDSFVGIRQFAGPIEDVAVWISPSAKTSEYTSSLGRGGYVVFPLRRGAGHLFRFFGAEFGYDGGIFPTDGPLVDAYWPAADASPTVTIR